MTPVSGKVERVNVLFVARELVTNNPLLNVPDLDRLRLALGLHTDIAARTHPDDLVFRTCRQILAVRAEANAPDVKIALLVRVAVLQVTDLLATHDIEDLCAAIAACCHIASVMAETNTAYHALMCEIVHEIDIKATLDAWVRIEHRVPIVSLPFQMRRKLLQLVVG